MRWFHPIMLLLAFIGCDAPEEPIGLCGNGIVDDGETCDGLAGCGLNEACSDECQCEALPCGPDTCADGCCDVVADFCLAGDDGNACGAGGEVCDRCEGAEQCIDGRCQLPCGPDTCADGCCNADGACVTDGQTDQQCGAGGEVCAACPPERSCNAGVCVGECDASNCAEGCCTPEGDCLTNERSALRCGTGGVACAACDDDELCNAGVCEAECNPESCPNGCCSADGDCLEAEQTVNDCGTGGERCAPCAGEEACINGECRIETPACDAQTCSEGCCLEDGTCLTAGRDDDRCGTGGAVCAPCGADLSCGDDGICRVEVQCGPGNCDGCCANGVCVLGDRNDQLCGAGGAQCAACGADEVCSEAGICQPACDAEFCPDGCCDGRACIIGDRNDQRCGTGGAQCAACGEDEVCGAAGVCQPACDAEFCPDGCCDGRACIIGDRNALRCGAGGAQCAPCSGNAECVEGICQEPCSPENCANGCCDGNRCVQGDEQEIAACGTAGNQCVACNVDTEICRGGVCVPACDAEFCPDGCCDGRVCLIGDRDDQRCGTGGAQCAACGEDEICGEAGVCQPACDAEFCPDGCCDGRACIIGDRNALRCGAGGAQCAPCSGNAECVDGVCQGPCSPENCANGCCDGNRCVQADEQEIAACGAGGNQCVACNVDTEICRDGVCVPACDAEFCPDGCCAGRVCLIGDRDDQRCGTGGAQCAACGEDEICGEAGVCQPACDAEFCPDGCCQGRACIIGDRNDQRCGTGGAQCAACGEDEICGEAGVCQPACDAAFCPDGCCDGRACIIGDRNALRCGAGGAQCAPCSGNAVCVDGVCQGPCSPENCPNGCCAGNQCVEAGEQGVAACGTAGNQCVACDLDTEICRDGACVPACDAEFCPDGCCDGRACIIGDRNDQRCGTGGAQCAACGEDEICGEAGVCQPACDAEFCPDGCCDGRACIIGDRNALRCGAGGAQCAPCSGDAQCIEGVCRGCDAETCPNGCCQDGQCIEPDDQNGQACGVGGAQCQACGEDDICRAGACVPACDAEFCPDGCCDGRACIIGDRNDQRCGTGGAQCAACPEGETCNEAGICEVQCGPGNCDGCCSPEGTCVPTQFQDGFACGQNGGACAVCSGDAVCVEGACEEPGGGGECACSTPGATVGPAPAGCDFNDANQCSGWQSVIIGSEGGGFTPEEEEEAFNRVVPDGTIFCAFGCCIQISCP